MFTYYYGFADASGGGLGSTVTIPGNSTGVSCRIGVWGKDDESESSNFKELENVVLTVEEDAKNGFI
jgi:hypothetical protein